MAKRPLFRGEWVIPATALFLSLAAAASFPAKPARAEEAGSPVLKPADSAAPEEKKPAEEKKPSGEPAKEKPAAPQSSDAKETKPQAPAADAKPGDAKAAESKAEEVKPLEQIKPAEKANGVKQAEPKEKPAGPKELRAEKPKDLTPKAEGGDFVVRASTIDAIYHISWLGIQIGDFRIRSSITNRQYSLQANANISVFFGSYTWQGATNSSGQMTSSGPAPSNYTFRYAVGERRETIELRFQQKMVQDITINPPSYPGSRRVPITAAHLQNVVDPASAIILLSQARSSREDVCNKRLPIFDGRIRYDLVLSPKGTRTIPTAGRLRGVAYVCSVRYVPVAGHKMGRPGENDIASGNTGIEVWLVPVPEAGLIVPYYVHVPTPAGTASMVTAKFDVQTPAGRHALAE